MTVLAALWNRDGRPAASGCEAMLEAQAPAQWRSRLSSDGAIALGSAARVSEPGEPAAAIVGGAGALRLVADARLDNRDELARSLGLAASAARLGDERLIMLCFERWGADAVQRLVGDFALALWDGKSEQLLLARDFAGQRPLHFHESRGFVAVASMPGGLHALAAVPRGVDQGRMLEMLVGLTDEGSNSFFDGIERVQPGETVTFRRGGRSARAYWTPPTSEIRFKRDSDYSEALLELLDAAVAARLHGSGPAIGTHLSAGLDSSAVTTSAALQFPGKVLAFTSVPPDRLVPVPGGRFGDERFLAAETAASRPNIDHRLIETGDRLELEDLEAQHRLFQRPDLNLPNLAWSNKINHAASAEGIETLLVGTMGNSTISYGGFDLIGAFLAKGRIGRFLSEWAAARKQGVDSRALLRSSAGEALPSPIVRALRSFRNREHHPATAAIANPRAPGVKAILERYDSYQAGFDSSFESRARTLRRVDPGTYNKGVLLGWNIDLRDPTGDRRLVEYCLRVPLRLYLRGGTTRALARDALRGRVPASVLHERQRGLQSPHWFSMLSEARDEAARQLERISECPIARTLIDVDKMRRLMAEWPDPAAAPGPAIYRYGLLRGLSAGGFIRLHALPGD